MEERGEKKEREKCCRIPFYAGLDLHRSHGRLSVMHDDHGYTLDRFDLSGLAFSYPLLYRRVCITCMGDPSDPRVAPKEPSFNDDG